MTLTWWRSFFSIVPLVSLSCSQLSNFCCSSFTFFKSGTESETCSCLGQNKNKGWDDKKRKCIHVHDKCERSLFTLNGLPCAMKSSSCNLSFITRSSSICCSISAFLACRKRFSFWSLNTCSTNFCRPSVLKEQQSKEGDYTWQSWWSRVGYLNWFIRCSAAMAVSHLSL